jgi:c(7)-type cytochrome triheme protein
MSRLTAGLVLIIGVLSAAAALAIQPGKTVTWNTSMGKVVFDGKNHADAKVGCLECHSKIFKMKKFSTEMKMADINAGKFCGKCHNGKRSFATNDKDNCEICHKK